MSGQWLFLSRMDRKLLRVSPLFLSSSSSSSSFSSSSSVYSSLCFLHPFLIRRPPLRRLGLFFFCFCLLKFTWNRVDWSMLTLFFFWSETEFRWVERVDRPSAYQVRPAFRLSAGAFRIHRRPRFFRWLLLCGVSPSSFPCVFFSSKLDFLWPPPPIAAAASVPWGAHRKKKLATKPHTKQFVRTGFRAKNVLLQLLGSSTRLWER